MSLIRRLTVAGVLAAVCYAAPTAHAQKRPNPDAATIADFKKRVDTYVALHKKLEDTLPHLPKDATPQQLDQHERALEKLMRANRTDAKQGDLFTPGMQRIIRKLLTQVFQGKGGAQLKKEIMEEYGERERATLAVNARYPDSVPLSTVPPQVLKGLPELPDELEYRFVGNNLILLDPHAHIIADYMERVF
jgi:type VI protein secretion system component VasK